MLTRWRLALGKLSKRMWFRSTLYGALGVITALAGAFLKFLIPHTLATRIGADSVGNILAILAASMLTVTTFSLSTMVSAYASASNSATPRAARLLIEDTRAQGALATFIGAFLFSIVGLIALSTGLYGEGGRLVLFGATIAVIVLITVTLLRSIEQFSRFGRLGETIDLVELATRDAMRRRAQDPLLGAAPGAHPPPDEAQRLYSEQVGYVEHLDVARLDAIAAEHALTIQVLCQPGTFATPQRPILAVAGRTDAALLDRLRAAVSVSEARSVEHDPRYGLVILAEIAQRSMSAAINDPGTCIDVIGTCVRLLCGWAHKRAHTPAPEIRYPHVRVAPLSERDMVEDAFAPIARDAAGALEVNIQLQKAFAAVARADSPEMREAALMLAQQSLQRGLQTLRFGPDQEALRAAALSENGIASASAPA